MRKERDGRGALRAGLGDDKSRRNVLVQPMIVPTSLADMGAMFCTSERVVGAMVKVCNMRGSQNMALGRVLKDRRPDQRGDDYALYG